MLPAGNVNPVGRVCAAAAPVGVTRRPKAHTCGRPPSALSDAPGSCSDSDDSAARSDGQRTQDGPAGRARRRLNTARQGVHRNPQMHGRQKCRLHRWQRRGAAAQARGVPCAAAHRPHTARAQLPVRGGTGMQGHAGSHPAAHRSRPARRAARGRAPSRACPCRSSCTAGWRAPGTGRPPAAAVGFGGCRRVPHTGARAAGSSGCAAHTRVAACGRRGPERKTLFACGAVT